MRSRLSNFEKFLGVLTLAGQTTKPLDVRNFQKGTIYLDTKGKTGGDIKVILEGTTNKGENRWINIDPSDKELKIKSDGTKAMTYEAEISYIRLRWVSGTANEIRVNAYISKTVTARK